MQGLTVREPLDGANGTALRLDGKHQAGADRLAVEQHGAGAARAVLAARMRAGQAAFFPDRIEQGAARLQLQSVGPTIDAQGEIRQCTHARYLQSGMHAWVRARYTMVLASSRRYCSLVCTSSIGSIAAAAAAAASRKTASPGRRPDNAASAASMRRGIASTPPRPMRGAAMMPLSMRSTTSAIASA